MTFTLPTTRERIRVAVQRRVESVSPLFDKIFGRNLEEDLERARRIARWLDAEYGVEGYRFGFETILGAIPVVGDTITTVIGLYPILVARRHNLGRWVQIRMGLNLGLEWLMGSVPLAGDALDTLMKANLRNLRLLEKAAAKKRLH